MDASELRAMQRVVKDDYRANPHHAMTLAMAEGIVDVEALTCRIVGEAPRSVAGLHQAAGGSGEFACSADLMLEALVACAGVTLAAVATAMSLEVRSARVIATGHWDARGTLGVDREVPVGMIDVRLAFKVDTPADDTTLARLIELVERYCVVAQTLQHPPSFTLDRDARAT